MANINGKKHEWANWAKKALAPATMTLAIVIAFLAAAVFYTPSRTDAAPRAGYENALSDELPDGPDVTSGDNLPTMRSVRISDQD